MLVLGDPIALHRLAELKEIVLWLHRHCLDFCLDDIAKPIYGKLKYKDYIVNVFGAPQITVVNYLYHF